MGLKNQLKKVQKKVKNAFDANFQQGEKTAGLGKQLYAISGGKVFGGIFAAMKLPQISAVTKRPNIIVGSYESDIHQALLEAVLWKPDHVINVGSAEGYFAVGLAMLLNDEVPVHAFELEERHWQDCAAMAAANGIQKSILQKGFCTTETINEIDAKRAFVFIDCEGGEMELLDPEKVTSLKTAFILCELHDFIVPKITATLIKRFKDTHTISVIFETAKNVGDYRILNYLESETDRALAIAEFRQIKNVPDQGRWMILKPKA